MDCNSQLIDFLDILTTLSSFPFSTVNFCKAPLVTRVLDSFEGF